MKTITIAGVEHVVVLATDTMHDAIRDLAKELGYPTNACGLCENRNRDKINCCPGGHISWLVRADVYPILKLRLPS